MPPPITFEEFYPPLGTWFEIRAYPAAEGLSVYVRDINRRKRAGEALRESEARLIKFPDALPVGVFFTTPDGGPYYVNRSAAELLGRGVAGGVKAVGISEAYAARLAGTRETYPAEWMPIVRALSGESASGDDMEVVRDGKITPLRIWAAPVLSPRGEVEFTITAFGDITEQRRAEDERERLIGELREALAEVKALRGILPICMYCKNIRDDENFWEPVEKYVSKHIHAQFSHSICPTATRSRPGRKSKAERKGQRSALRPGGGQLPGQEFI